MSTNTNNHKIAGNINSLSNKHQLPPTSQPQPQHHQSTNLSSAVQGTQNQQQTIPPRYQPPPQPPGGILKNIPSSKTVSSYYTSEQSNGPQQLKYPPDVPKVAAVYIPESVRSANPKVIPSRLPNYRHSTGHVLSQPQQITQHTQIQIHQPPQQQNSRLISDENQNHRQSQQSQEMLKFVRKPENETSVATNSNTGRLSAEQNRHLQTMITELRTLKDANQRLSDDNQELRDLCCFLDDDRQKGRKLAREWQRFGRYTASVMRQEVSAYQNKLRQLDDKQQELIRDNLELKELCLYLDEERANVASNVSVCTNCGASVRAQLRDDGDGSSSSTNADEPMPTVRQFERQVPELNIRPTLSDQTLQYVRSLERKIRQLEQENHSDNSQKNGSSTDHITGGRPEAVVRALQILEVREQLERERTANGLPTVSPEHMDDGEKALVLEMCNVVWRKLEDSPNGPEPI
ncbi:hypothetical protein HA402_011978 [Bradysia odoriphaga]|nr:hypothetical protein HA402_011978 [Bradysia odoriphaga]